MPQSPDMTPVREQAAGSTRLALRTSAILLLWYAAALLPTLIFKSIWVHARYRRPLPVEIGALTGFSSGPARRLATVLFFGRDFFEVALIIAVIFVLGRLLLRIRLSLLVPASLALLYAVMAANYIALVEVQEYLSPEALTIALSWLRDNPTIARKYVGTRPIVVLLAFAALSALPLWVARRLPPPAADGAAKPRAGSIALAMLSAVSIAVYLAVPALVPAYPPTVRGYWASTAFSLAEIPVRKAVAVPEMSAAQISKEYDALAWPSGEPARGAPLVEIPAPSARARHVLIVALETASRTYYPILDDPSLPSFGEMSRSAIVSRRHHTTTPFTTWSNYSIVTGTYPPRSRQILGRGVFESDGLGTVLSRLGYETLFLDSYRIDWHGLRYRRILKSIGFTSIRDRSDYHIPERGSQFDNNLAVEEHSLSLAEEAILGAQGRGRKAFVFISTTLGHYEWRARPGQDSLPADRKILEIARAFDVLMGSLLKFLDKHQLREETLVVVTGDHGLRYEAEFASLGETMTTGESTFNVPFLLFAPGLLKERVELPWVTSHVDIAPTLLQLMGIPSESLVLHGSSMLDPRIERRATFFLNTGLTPVDGFHWDGRLFTWDSGIRSGEVAGIDEAAGRPLRTAAGEEAGVPDPLKSPGDYIESANRLFDATAAAFVTRSPKSKR